MIFKELSSLTSEEKGRILSRELKVDRGVVEKIISDVKKRGDAALKEYTQRFDGASLDSLVVSETEFEEAWEKADKRIVEAIKTAHENISSYHTSQLEEEWWTEQDGRKLGQIIRPVESVGCYVPGGRAFYPSTVLMASVPAKVAGVKRIVCASPPKKDGAINEHILVACSISGVSEVYKVGGAQAVAALAYGTISIPRVDLIVGPGNVYVTAAKKAVFGDVGVDMLAGPSEILIIADKTGNPDFVLADLLAQAEHDPMATCVLITTDRELGKSVRSKIQMLGKKIPPALEKASILVSKTLDEALEFSNEFAPEHLVIISDDEKRALKGVKNAGSIFLGNYSPVAAGDYASGPNHILPTAGCARFQSGLNVGHFLRRISVQSLSKKGLEKVAEPVQTLAEAEGLKKHSDSVKERLK